MAEPPSPDELRSIFQELLNLALTSGRGTSSSYGLGPNTLAAIDVVAYEHPDVEADCMQRHMTPSITNTAKPGGGFRTSRTEFGPATQEVIKSGEAEEIRRELNPGRVIGRRVNVVRTADTWQLHEPRASHRRLGLFVRCAAGEIPEYFDDSSRRQRLSHSLSARFRRIAGVNF